MNSICQKLFMKMSLQVILEKTTSVVLRNDIATCSLVMLVKLAINGQKESFTELETNISSFCTLYR